MSAESQRIAKSVSQKRAERCKHFNGVQNDKCEAGISYKELQEGGRQLPCLPWHNRIDLREVAKCDKYDLYTAEELVEQERRINQNLQRIEKVMVSIRPFREQVRKTKTSFAGMIDCVACGGKDTLALNISSHNGHARGKFECGVCWIE